MRRAPLVVLRGGVRAGGRVARPAGFVDVAQGDRSPTLRGVDDADWGTNAHSDAFFLLGGPWQRVYFTSGRRLLADAQSVVGAAASDAWTSDLLERLSRSVGATGELVTPRAGEALNVPWLGLILSATYGVPRAQVRFAPINSLPRVGTSLGGADTIPTRWYPATDTNAAPFDASSPTGGDRGRVVEVEPIDVGGTTGTSTGDEIDVRGRVPGTEAPPSSDDGALWLAVAIALGLAVAK